MPVKRRNHAISLTLGLICMVLVTVGVLISRNHSNVISFAPCLRLDLAPGKSQSVSIGEDVLTISIPTEEAYSIGTLSVVINGTTIATFERDGMPESLHVDDVTGDGMQDMVLVNRSAGSGGYVDIWLLERTATGFDARRLPELSAKLLNGYGGHDVVGIIDGNITRLHPRYAKHIELTFSLKSFPIQLVPDANSSPTGGQKLVAYDVETDQWQLVD